MSVGPVVNIAARLQQRADPGEILVGPTTHGITDDVAEFEPLPDADLKGIGRLPVWRLLRVGTATRATLPFVGRDDELVLLGLAHDRARKGRSVLAVVSGPPGQGKTRLVQEFLRGRADGHQVIAARCRPADEVGVFAPVREILGVATLDELAVQVGRLCSNDAECERVVAGLAESAGIGTRSSLAGLPAAEREDEIVEAWRRYLGILDTGRLVVLAVDDIHWADPSLVRLVDRLTFGGSRLLVIATARPEFAEAAGIRPSGDRFFIELGGLEREDALVLARGAGADDQRVIERAEGNPLFLVELARAGADLDALPLTIQGALGARLDQLAPVDRALLSRAAVAGEIFTAADAAFLAERDAVETSRALARLVDLNFLDLAPTGYRFHHGLVRDVAHGRLPLTERMRAHARFAHERARPEDVEGRAHHWWEALRPPDGEWVWGDDAGLPGMRREAFAAHLAAGTLHARHAVIDQAVELLGRAVSFASDDRERAQAEQALGLAYRQVLRQDEAWGHLSRSLALFRASGAVPLDLYADLVDAAVYYGAFRQIPSEDEVVGIAEEGAAAARAANDVRTLSQILRARGAYLLNVHEAEPERAAPFIDAAVTAAEASGNTEARRLALLTKSQLLVSQGRVDESTPFLEAAKEALDGANAFAQLRYVQLLAESAWLGGDVAAAEARARQAVTLAEPMGPHNRTHAWVHLSAALVARADWPGLIELAQRTARLVVEERASAFCPAAAVVLRDGAIAHALRGEREEARELLAAMPTSKVIEVALLAAVPRALLGFATPEADARLASGTWAWWEWIWAAQRAVIQGRPDDAERALGKMGALTTSSVLGRAFADVVHEAIAELRGGPPATYDALRRIGYTGWIEILRRRVVGAY